MMELPVILELPKINPTRAVPDGRFCPYIVLFFIVRLVEIAVRPKNSPKLP